MGSDSDYHSSDSKTKSSAIEFTPEDVEANRRGKLTPRQDALRHSEPELESATKEDYFMWSLLFLPVTSCFVLSVVLQELKSEFILGISFMIVPCILVLIGLIVLKGNKNMPQRHQNLRSSPDRSWQKLAVEHYPRVVLHLDGTPRIQQREGYTWLIVHGQSFAIRPATAAFFSNPGTYRVYYLSGSGRFLSAEYLADKLFKG